MFGKFTKENKRSNLEKEIDSLLAVMSTTQPASDEYKTMSENLERLYKAKSLESERKRKVSPDTIAVGMFSIGQMLLLLNYEKMDIVRSKALGFIFKGRV